MRCEDVALLLPAAVDSNEPVELPVQRHIEGCLRCQAELARYRRMLRGLGVADLLQSLNDGPLRVHPELAAHVLEVLEAVEASNTTGNRIAITSRPARPAARTA